MNVRFPFMPAPSECGSPKHRTQKSNVCRVVVLLGLAKLAVVVMIASSVRHKTTAGGATPVLVEFYGEALCPDCAAFTTRVLGSLWDEGLNKIMTLRYIGWGNVKNTTTGHECQHGPQECQLNRVLNCGSTHSTDQEQFFSFLMCLTTKGHAMADFVEACAQSAGLDYREVDNCAKGSEGDRLEREAAAATRALTPPHQYVPWVVVNGIALGPDCGNAKGYICAAYAGERPPACYARPSFKLCPGATSR